MKRIIHLDMDGVLVDLDDIIRKKTGTHWTEQPSSTKMWAIIREKLPNMFVDAKPMPDARQLVDGVLEHAAHKGWVVEILTAVPKLATFPDAVKQKQAWIKQHFPELANVKFKIGPHSQDKQNHAIPGDILIDDNAKNIVQWDAKGGVAIFHHNAALSLTMLYAVDVT